jgi:hypothetical protein
MNVRQSMVAALVLEGQPRVLDPQAVEDGRVQVVHLDGILHDVVAVIVRLAER